MGVLICIVLSIMLVVGAFSQYADNHHESGSMLMVAASICLLASVIASMFGKPSKLLAKVRKLVKAMLVEYHSDIEPVNQAHGAPEAKREED